MRLIAFKSKIHRARVTEANLNYEGSVTVDADLLDAADILPHEQVQILNLHNGERFETYAIRGPRGSGVVCLNGPSARLAQVGDTILIVAYAAMEREELERHTPRIVHVDDRNRIVHAPVGSAPGGRG
ncbi:MAG: aspartate 1-decarboxylase [Hyphomicrobiales bacterium]